MANLLKALSHDKTEQIHTKSKSVRDPKDSGKLKAKLHYPPSKAVK